ncbi:hypothetical protein CGRA01v4_03506 [Colletotrichum graminicola]|nr:hypothetical protein CGRA01v4_03506 [Colletotrichum graminicola]
MVSTGLDRLSTRAPGYLARDPRARSAVDSSYHGVMLFLTSTRPPMDRSTSSALEKSPKRLTESRDKSR